MKKILKVAGISLGVLIIVGAIAAYSAGITPISFGLHDPVYQASGKALEGYDVVSYFQGEPKMGQENLSHQWNEVTWLFSSEENLNAFKTNPKKYSPQFGGYCAFAVSTGFTAPTDPTVWAVKDNKLYIFSDEEVKAEFMADSEGFVSACEASWGE